MSRNPRGLGSVVATMLMLATVGACGSDDTDSEATTDVTTSEQREIPGVAFQPDAAAMSPDGDLVTVPCSDDLCVWETTSGELVDTWSGGHLVAWSPEGDLLATNSGSEDGKAGIVLLAADGGDEVQALAGHEIADATDGSAGEVTDLAFSPDGSTLASSGTDGTVRLWSTADGSLLQTLETTSDRPDSLAFDPTGDRLAVAALDAEVEVWDVGTGQVEGTLQAESQAEVVWSPDGELIATDTRAATDSATVTLWNAESLRRVGQSPVMQADQLAFSSDGSTLAISLKDTPEVFLWPIDGGAGRSLVGAEETVRAVMWSPDDSHLLAVGARDGVVSWTVGDGAFQGAFEPLGA